MNRFSTRVIGMALVVPVTAWWLLGVWFNMWSLMPLPLPKWPVVMLLAFVLGGLGLASVGATLARRDLQPWPVGLRRVVAAGLVCGIVCALASVVSTLQQGAPFLFVGIMYALPLFSAVVSLVRVFKCLRTQSLAT